MTTHKVYIIANHNNTIITLTTSTGNTLYWQSTGRQGFTNTKKATPFSASLAAKNIKSFIKKHNYHTIDIYIKGFGQGRDISIKTLSSNSYTIRSISDITPILFNGCKPPKEKRV